LHRSRARCPKLSWLSHLRGAQPGEVPALRGPQGPQDAALGWKHPGDRLTVFPPPKVSEAGGRASLDDFSGRFLNFSSEEGAWGYSSAFLRLVTPPASSPARLQPLLPSRGGTHSRSPDAAFRVRPGRPASARGGLQPRPALLPSFLLHHQRKPKPVAPPFSLPPEHLAGLPRRRPVYVRDPEPPVCVRAGEMGPHRTGSFISLNTAERAPGAVNLLLGSAPKPAGLCRLRQPSVRGGERARRLRGGGFAGHGN